MAKMNITVRPGMFLPNMSIVLPILVVPEPINYIIYLQSHKPFNCMSYDIQSDLVSSKLKGPEKNFKGSKNLSNPKIV